MSHFLSSWQSAVMPGVVALAVAAPYKQAVIKRKHKKRPEQKDKIAKSDNLRV
jgi:hypothetical protein